MRNLEVPGVQLRDRPLQEAEALGPPELGCRLEQELHPEADPEHRLTIGRAFGDRLVEAQLLDPLHRLRERANAGKDEPVGVASPIGLARPNGVDVDVRERLLDRTEVAHAVVEDANARRLLRFASGADTVCAHASVPLVDGTPVSSGSIDTASRSARANA